MKKLILLLTLFTLILPTRIKAEEPYLYSQQAIVIEAKTKRVLFEKNGYQKGYPASLTKLLTLLIALEEGNLEDQVYVDKESVTFNETSHAVPFYAGETLRFEDILYGAGVASGNETCNLIAKHLSGSVNAFVDKMNQKAKELGATNTHFSNPHGLYRSNHYSTAYDMALIMNEGLKNPLFRQILSTTNHIIEQTSTNRYHKVNSLVKDLLTKGSSYYREGIVAAKSGYTDKERHCMAAYYEVNGMEFIIITMRCQRKDDRFKDVMTLYDYVLKNYQSVHLQDTLNTPLTLTLPERYYFEDQTTSPLTYHTDTSWLIEKEASIQSVYEPIQVEGVMNKGDQVGTMTFTQGDLSETIPVYLNTNILKTIYIYETPEFQALMVMIVIVPILVYRFIKWRKK